MAARLTVLDVSAMIRIGASAGLTLRYAGLAGMFGGSRKPSTPASTRAAVSSVVPTGRRMNGAEMLINDRGGPRYGPPHPPSLGRAPAEPWRASSCRGGRTRDR